jgi:hypothetical protein
MHIARLPFLVSVLLALAVAGCTHAASKPRMTEQDAIRVVKSAMSARFPNSVAAHEPYHAEFRQGVWSVWGTVPQGMFGGGAPEAAVRDSDGKVTDVHLSR